MRSHLRSSGFILLSGLLSVPPLVSELPYGLQKTHSPPTQYAPFDTRIRSGTSSSRTFPTRRRQRHNNWRQLAMCCERDVSPEDATDYYLYALRRGGNEIELMNKLGVTQLDLRHTAQARAYFERALHLKQKDAVAWNNLGAVEYIDGRFATAISDYGRAIKLDKKSATFHSNLATALFEEKKYKDARNQFKIALQLDPDMAHRDGVGGLTAHMISPEDHARYCFEMAKLYAELGDETNMLHYLTMASENGFDVMGEMRSDSALDRYRKDARVILLVRNAKALRSGPCFDRRCAEQDPTVTAGSA